MITSIPETQIIPLLCHQLEGFFPIDATEKECIKSVLGGGKKSYREVL